VAAKDLRVSGVRGSAGPARPVGPVGPAGQGAHVVSSLAMISASSGSRRPTWVSQVTGCGGA